MPPILIEQALLASGVINSGTTATQAYAALLHALTIATAATGEIVSEAVLAAELSSGGQFAQHIARRIALTGLNGAQGEAAVGMLSNAWRTSVMAAAGEGAAAGAAETAVVVAGETAVVATGGVVTNTLATIGGWIGLQGAAAVLAGSIAVVAVLAPIVGIGAKVIGTLSADSPVEPGYAMQGQNYQDEQSFTGTGRNPDGLIRALSPIKEELPLEEVDEVLLPSLRESNERGTAFDTPTAREVAPLDEPIPTTPTSRTTPRQKVQPVKNFAGRVYRFQVFETDQKSGKRYCLRDHFNLKTGTIEEVEKHWNGRQEYIRTHTKKGQEYRFTSIRYDVNLTNKEADEFFRKESKRMTAQYGGYTNMGFPGLQNRKYVN